MKNYLYFLVISNFIYLESSEQLSFPKDEILTKICFIKNKITSKNFSYRSDRFKIVKRNILDLICMLNPVEFRIKHLKERYQQAYKEVKQKLKVKKVDKRPVISFFVPVYNREYVVKDAIESIYRQQLNVPYEVVVVDDASTDRTPEVLVEYEKKYDNFFHYQHECNKGAPATRNTAILHCRGKYVFNVDSDDIVLPASVQKLYDYMEEHDIEVSFFGEYHLFKDFDSCKIIAKQTGNQRGEIYTVFDGIKTECAPIACGCRLYTKKSWERVGGYLEAAGQDTWSFSYMQLASGLKAYVLPEVGYLHRTWTSKECYTLQNVCYNWDESPLLAVRSFPELLSQEDFKVLEKCVTYNGQFIYDCLHNKLITLRPSQQLNFLFAATNLLERKMFFQAKKMFVKTIENGCNHLNVYLKLLEASFYDHDLELVLKTLDRIEAKI